MRTICKLLVMVMFLEAPMVGAARAGDISTAADNREPNVVIRAIRDTIASRPADFVDADELDQTTGMMNKAQALEGVEALIKRLKDPDESFDAIKQDFVKQALEEEETQVLELNRLLLRMDTKDLDRIFEATQKTGAYSSDKFLEYISAYKADEKRAVLFKLAKSDISQIRSTTLKRLGLMEREMLIEELQTTKSVLNVKDADTWLIVAAVVLTVAAAGFVGYAIVKGVKNRFIRKSKDLDKEYQDKFDQAYAEFLKDEKDVIAFYRERERLREEGYVWTVCSTAQSNAAATCSYDHRSYSGTQVCVTRCLKQPRTGEELYKTTSCTSAYVPSNCMQMNPYEKGYSDGYSQGVPDGYHDGYSDYYWKGYNDYYSKGYDAGYVKGYDYGYDDGYTDGYNQAVYDATHRAGRIANTSDSVFKGYSKGYQEGYTQALSLLSR